ncbi:MAG: NADH-quinone oxidoreductase subunit C [Planctomycetes bacterium]|nr:NADH-quinone oxidoreductase subunit C [Planctomycetota bacterium]
MAEAEKSGAAGAAAGKAAAPKGPGALSRRIAKGKADAAKLFPILKEKFGAAILEEQPQVVEPFVVIDPEILVEFAAFCRDDARLQFDLLSLISTVDYPPKDAERGTIQVIYFLDSTAHRHRLMFKVKLPRDNPRVPSVENLWRAADWHEREAFDLMGVIFEGHHNLVRILCAEDWEGHALRKDYVIPETYHGIKNVIY